LARTTLGEHDSAKETRYNYMYAETDLNMALAVGTHKLELTTPQNKEGEAVCHLTASPAPATCLYACTVQAHLVKNRH
jgi:hypothetical protein